MVSDNARIAELVELLETSIGRTRELSAYLNERADGDLTAVLAGQADAVTPPVAGEDAAWEALVEHDDHLLRLLRIITATITSSLDGEGC